MAIIAETHRNMVEHMTIGIVATRTRAGILTLLTDTCQLARAFRTQNTFWPTIGRCSNVIRQA